ncbi:transcription antitermination factor NusB [uncultured Helicobacter sp.]|uniref:transcription antitermination factor NusB n=1 Tax=uncultured Helicobacter sp. TaxID=175537 RepID=UPI00344DAFAF
MATRSQVREVVVQLLYAYGSGNDGISKFVEEILEEHKIKNAQQAFAKELFSGVLTNLEVLDLRITHQLKGWDFERIGDIERAILRLGAYEILFSKIDKAVVINEALEIAKHFSYESSTKFINGVLDGIVKNSGMPLEEIAKTLKEQTSKEEEQAPKELKTRDIKTFSKQKATLEKPKPKANPPKQAKFKNLKPESKLSKQSKFKKDSKISHQSSKKG